MAMLVYFREIWSQWVERRIYGTRKEIIKEYKGEYEVSLSKGM